MLVNLLLESRRIVHLRMMLLKSFRRLIKKREEEKVRIALEHSDEIIDLHKPRKTTSEQQKTIVVRFETISAHLPNVVEKQVCTLL